MCSLENKTAIITGSSGGIGKETAKFFLDRGANVVINGRDETRLRATYDELAKANANQLLSVCADVSRPDDVKRLFDEVQRKWGAIDILVNNAAIYRNSHIARMDETEWSEVIDNNLKSAYLCSRFAARVMMKARKGRIINISSVVALGGNPFQANYAASKAGMDGMMMAIAKELAPYGVTVNSVAPGWIDAGMARQFTEEQKKELLQFIPMQRPGHAREVAAVIAFLASDEASYITGQVIQVDGGRIIR